MYLTLYDARTSSLRNISGACNNSDDFRELLNDAARRLLRRGDWLNTVIRLNVCAYQGCVVWPRFVAEVRKINLCSTPIDNNNIWYSFQNNEVSGDAGSCCSSRLGPEAKQTSMGVTPTFYEIGGDARYIRVYPSVLADVGKTVRIFGFDNNGQRLTTQDSATAWSDGINLVIASPYASTTVYVSKIERLLWDSTNQGVNRLFAYNTATSLLEPVGEYEPGDTNPAFTRYQLSSGCDCTSALSVSALVKLKFVPVKVDNDLVLVENLDALRLMMQSLKHEEAGDRKAAREYEADAIRELNLDLWNRDQENIPVSLGELGGTGAGRQRCF